MRTSFMMVAAAALLSAACGDKKKDASEPSKPESMESAGGSKVIEEQKSRCDSEDHRIENTDLNNDTVVDVRNVFATIVTQGIEHEVLVCKETDLNFDGKKDIIRYFSDEGRPLRQEVDLDFDGHIDVITYFEDGVITKSEYDTNFDGKVDMVNFYVKGKLSQSERDRNFDSTADTWKPDEWQHFDEQGVLLRIGYDTDGDDKVDYWERADTGEPVEGNDEEGEGGGEPEGGGESGGGGGETESGEGEG